MINRQNQEGGDGSTNIQAQHVVMNVGIDEKRAREIYQEMSLQQRNDYSQEALQIANRRVEAFENRLMPKMQGALEAFADPSFQLLLVEAQKTAASTERAADYDLLSELLIHRFQKGEDRIVRAGISRAVEIVDEVSDDALLGLTVFHSVSQFLPVTGDIHQGLDILNDLFGALFYGELPKGNNWLDHLDILDAVRLSSFSTLKPLQQFYPERLAGYVDVGIKKDSEDYKKAVEILRKHDLSESILVEHTLDNDYVRLSIPDKTTISDLSINRFVAHSGMMIPVQKPISTEEIEAINSVYELYEKSESKKQDNIKSFMNEWDKRANLKRLREWWDNIGTSFQITSVGKVLAHSNAQRCDKRLPPLN
ncbi:TPA: LPO_1073/Vpar_1526 family protein [Photobacterium damselae]